jgi:hypothetical protein
MRLLPKSIFATLVLIGLNAAFWLIYALIVAFGLISSFTAYPVLRWTMAILAMGASVCMAGLVLLLYRHSRLAFHACCIMLAAVAILSVTDQVGWPDILTFLISLAALGLMLKDRKWYLQKPSWHDPGPEGATL